MGIKYEKQIAQAIPAAIHGQWFEYCDESGIHFCQTDFLFSLADVGMGILEAKYTWTREGQWKLANLYIPVVRAAFGRSVWGVEICRRILPEMEGISVSSSLDSAFESAIDGQTSCLHWIGSGPIFGSQICQALPKLEMVN